MRAMLHAIMMRFFVEGEQKFYVKESTIPGAGSGLFAAMDIRPGQVIAMLGTTLLRQAMHNQMVQYCDDVPWNNLHPKFCMGGMANSCGADLARENVGFYPFNVDTRSGPHRVLLLVALEPIPKREECLVKYPIHLAPSTILVLTAEQREIDVDSVSRDEYEGRRSPSVDPPSSREPARLARQAAIRAANEQELADVQRWAAEQRGPQ